MPHATSPTPWASYVFTARREAGLSQEALARLLGKDRATIYRWEKGRARPEDPEIVRQLAEVLELDPEEAATAAGLRPGRTPPTRPQRPPDPELDTIRASKLSEERKRELIKWVLARRERERAAGLADVEMLIRMERER